jgi:AcrR family transcriptional regulator
MSELSWIRVPSLIVTSTYKARFRQERSAGSVDALLDAAEAVFARLGVSGATTVLIAKEAGISVGGLYYWFTDKAAVAAALSQRHQQRLETFLVTELVSAVHVQTTELIPRLATAISRFARENPGALALLRRDAIPEATDSDETRPSMREQMIALVAGMIEQRVDGTTHQERHLVATIVIQIVVAVLDLSLTRDSPSETDIESELAYLMSAYLYARYPSIDENVAPISPYPIRPARLPLGPAMPISDIRPVLPTMPGDS